jgi:hypothetical protein
MKLTRWFGAGTKPVHKGVYERRIDDCFWNSPLYAYWDGTRWYMSDYSVQGAVKLYERDLPSIRKVKWRGLAEKAS